ncbi:unnamed protein product [Lampetra planeri]
MSFDAPQRDGAQWSSLTVDLVLAQLHRLRTEQLHHWCLRVVWVRYGKPLPLCKQQQCSLDKGNGKGANGKLCSSLRHSTIKTPPADIHALPGKRSFRGKREKVAVLPHRRRRSLGSRRRD